MKSDQPYKAHVIDPSADLEDVIGDTSGKTGATTNARNDKGNAPMGTDMDKTHLPGGVIQTPKTIQVKNDPADPDQNPKTPQSLPDNVALRANDIATEPDEFDLNRNTQPLVIINTTGQEQSNEDLDLDNEADIKNRKFVSPASPDEIDEQSMMGSASDPESPLSDDDTLDVAHAMGQQLEEDEEHPQELDIARDIDKAEEFVHDQ